MRVANVNQFSLEKSKIYEISNKNGVRLRVSNFGLRILSLYVPNKNGDSIDVVLGFNNLDDYLHESTQYFGSIVGQYANRIKDAQFNLNGVTYYLEKNEGDSHIHGGSNGYHFVHWNLVKQSSNKLRFHCFFPDKENGYPGNTHVFVNYSISDKNEFIIEYEATSDADTIINLTNHSYFNLKGEGNGNILDHWVSIDSNYYLSVDDNSIPREISSVEGTPLDFRIRTMIGSEEKFQHKELKNSLGFDHCYVLKDELNQELVHAATVEESEGGIIMKVFTNEPGFQFYTGNFIDGDMKGKLGETYKKYAGFCIETQRFPNSPNREDFPSSILRSNERYTSKTIYQFLVNNQLT